MDARESDLVRNKAIVEQMTSENASLRNQMEKVRADFATELGMREQRFEQERNSLQHQILQQSGQLQQMQEMLASVMQSRNQDNDGNSKPGENRLYGTSAASSSIAGGLAHQTREDHDMAMAMQIAEMNYEESLRKESNQQLVQQSASNSAKASLHTSGVEDNISIGHISSRTVLLRGDVQSKKTKERQ